MVKETTFYHLWRTLYPKMLVPKGQRLGMCKECAERKAEMEKAQTKEEREEIRKKLKIHLDDVAGERGGYHLVRKEARDDPKL